MDITELNYDLPTDDIVVEEPEIKQWLTSEQAGLSTTNNVVPPTQPQEPGSNEPPVVEPSNNEGDSTDVLKAYLSYCGISDPTKIKYETEDGLINEQDWNELSSEEQFNILKSFHQNPEYDLDSSEINLINSIRRSKLTPAEYIKSLQGNSNQDTQELGQYNFDEMSDDEIYAIDLVSRTELTDEEVEAALESAKQNPEVFAKQVAGIRNNIKSHEAEQAEQRKQLAAQEYQNFENSIIESIEGLTNIGGVDITLQEDDMNELANFILPENGVSSFGQMMKDPKEFVKIAYFARFGDKIMEDISDYVADQVKQARQAGYTQGLMEGQKGGTGKNKVVVKPKPSTNTQPSSFLDLNY